MQNIIIVGIGGFIGSILRYLASYLINSKINSILPFGTLSVNIIGCFAIGTLWGYVDTLETFNQSLRLFLFVGILGGFTTFSSFGYETIIMLKQGHFFFSLINISIHLIAGLGAVMLGYKIGS